MANLDGFVLTHTYEVVDVPDSGTGRRVSPQI